MTFPVLQSLYELSVDQNPSGATAVVTLPSGVTAGDMLYLAFSQQGTAGSITAPAGWSTAFNDGAVATDGAECALFYKTATGSEGASVSVTHTSAQGWCAVTWRISGADTGAPAVSTRTAATSATHTFPALTSGFGAVDTVWIAVAFEKQTHHAAPSTYPSNFPDNHAANDLSGGTTGGTSPMTAKRSENASSQASQSFTWDTSDPGVAFQFAVQPGSAVVGANFFQVF